VTALPTGRPLLAVDPGPTDSGYVVLTTTNRIAEHGIEPNHVVVNIVADWGHTIAIEWFSSYGMPVGAEVFDTCMWVGRYIQAAHDPDQVQLITRTQVKLAVCGNAAAKDPNIRQALIDLHGPAGRKANPGPTYGIRSHEWSALAVATAARLQAAT
jgi:hypothetical protein